ncbi:MAG: alpha/beta hydrolase [Pseudomonadota bacterium]
MWFIKFIVGLAGVYAIIVVAAYFLQAKLIFPSGLVGQAAGLPANSTDIELQTPDGETVVMTRIPPRADTPGQHPVLLGFGGNAWSGGAVALLLHRVFPDHEVLAVNYRGYGPSSGSPSAKALFDDAILAYDHVAAQSDAGLVAVGFSIGASVAVDLASNRQLNGLVLVTPFDSMEELAAGHYPFLPVRSLLRHHMDTAATLRDLDLPVAIMTAGRDTVVPAARSAPVRKAAADLRSDIAIEDAGHNDIYARAEFPDLLRQSVAAVKGD